MDLNDKLEELASKSAAREEYDKYLYMLLEQMGVIELVSNNYKTTKSIKLLAETYAVASISSSGGSKDQIMYDILREIAYKTALNKDYTTSIPYYSSFVLDNALIIVKNAKKGIKIK